MEWQPIETAPKHGRNIICWAHGWDYWQALAWKHNPRTKLDYFGDPYEMDDYHHADNQPTHWLPVPQVPSVSI